MSFYFNVYKLHLFFSIRKHINFYSVFILNITFYCTNIIYAMFKQTVNPNEVNKDNAICPGTE